MINVFVFICIPTPKRLHRPQYVHFLNYTNNISECVCMCYSYYKINQSLSTAKEIIIDNGLCAFMIARNK